MEKPSTPTTPTYGLLAEFADADALARAASRIHQAGYTKLDAFTPVPIEGLAEAMGHHDNRVQRICLTGGIIGGLSGYLLAWACSAWLYPDLNVGGRPLHSWPAFIIPTFEMTILFASFSAAIGMLALNGLPMPYHPVFNVPSFQKASSEGYFLVVEAADPRFAPMETRRALESAGALEVHDVAH